MKSKIVILAVGLLLANTTTVFAQSTTGRKIEKVGKDVEKADDAIEKGKRLVDKLFKKRKKEDEDQLKKTQNETDPPVSEEEPTKENEAQNPNVESKENREKEAAPVAQTPDQLKPGDIHPDAVVLDVDKLYPFYDGAAIVKKGSSTALINAKGEFIVPFNEYQFNTYENYSKNGFFLLSDMFSRKEGRNGFVNAKGKYIDLQEFYGVTTNRQVIGNYFILGDRKSNSYIYYFVDRQGNKYTLTDLGPYRTGGDAILNDGLVPFAKNYKYGYKNIENKIVVNAVYDFAMPFSDGAAVVGAKNEFGEMKYGYVDTQGKPITPLQFSKMPESFSNGRAKVYYNDVLNKYSFIDKKGEIVFTETNMSYYGPYYNGFAIAVTGRQNERIMDKEGRKYSVEEFLKLFGVTDVRQGSVGITLPVTYTNEIYDFGNSNKIRFHYDSSHDGPYNGFINVDNSSAIYGKFSTGNGPYKQNFNFDPISKLAYGIFDKSKNPGDVREGHINEDGIFMIVKGEASKW